MDPLVLPVVFRHIQVIISKDGTDSVLYRTESVSPALAI
jgi:hypothetical protein